MLSSSAGYREVQAMGWLSEQVHLGGDSSHTEWKPVFVALTEKDMLLYVAAPWSRDDWSAPVMSHPLLATRWVTFWFKALTRQSCKLQQVSKCSNLQVCLPTTVLACTCNHFDQMCMQIGAS